MATFLTSFPFSRHRWMQTCQASPSPPTSERFWQRLQASQKRPAYKPGQEGGRQAASQKCLSNIPKCASTRTPQRWWATSNLILELFSSPRNKSGTTCSFSTRAILQLPVTLFFHIKAGIKDDQVDLCLLFCLIWVVKLSFPVGSWGWMEWWGWSRLRGRRSRWRRSSGSTTQLAERRLNFWSQNIMKFKDIASSHLSTLARQNLYWSILIKTLVWIWSDLRTSWLRQNPN